MIVILLVLFNVRWRLLPLGIVLIGVIWAFGLAGYLGIPLTLVTISGLPVMLGIGIDYAIQMHARVEEEVIIDRAEHPIQETRPQPRSCAARRDVRRDLRVRGAALRQGADDPAASVCCSRSASPRSACARIIGPLAVLGIREYKSPTKGARLPRGPARPARRLARQRAVGARTRARDRAAS